MNQRHRNITAASRSHVRRGIGEGQRRNAVLRDIGEHQRFSNVYVQGELGPKIEAVRSKG